MNQLPKRKDVALEHRWNLEDLFPNQQAWDKEYQLVKDDLKEIGRFEGKLNDPAAIKKMLRAGGQNFPTYRTTVCIRQHEAP